MKFSDRICGRLTAEILLIIPEVIIVAISSKILEGIYGKIPEEMSEGITAEVTKNLWRKS